MSLSFDIKKSFGEFSIDLSLELGGELVVLFGPSGAGKTQALRMISGLTRPDSGRVVIDGTPVFDSKERVEVPIRERRTGYLFQDYALFPHMTVSGNIAYGMSAIEAVERSTRVTELVELMRLTGLESRYPRALSGGQKQRTALARTLATGPRVLLLDEPFSALDQQVREKLRGDLLNIHEAFPITTVLVTHDLEEAFMLGARIAVVNNGRVEQFGSREEVFYRPATKNVARFMGVKNIFSGNVRGRTDGMVVIDSPELGEITAAAHAGRTYTPGQVVSFCIRPEEIPVIRPDRVIGDRVKENIVTGTITRTTGKGSTQVLFIAVDRSQETPGVDGAELKVEVPNFVARKMGLATGGRITVSLKKESLWVIP